MNKLTPIAILFFIAFLSSHPVSGMGILSELWPSIRRSVTPRFYHTAQDSELFSWNKGYVPTKQAQERTPISLDSKSNYHLYFDSIRRLAYIYKPDVKNLFPSSRRSKNPSQENK